MKIIIPGKPIAKKRPRFSRRGKFVVTYSAQKEVELEVSQVIQRQAPGCPIESPISIYLWFGMPIPKSTSKKQSQLMRGGFTSHAKRPDLDNLVKFYLYVMNDLVFKDDSQIFYLTAFKEYTDKPRTEIVVTETQKTPT